MEASLEAMHLQKKDKALFYSANTRFSLTARLFSKCLSILARRRNWSFGKKGKKKGMVYGTPQKGILIKVSGKTTNKMERGLMFTLEGQNIQVISRIS